MNYTKYPEKLQEMAMALTAQLKGYDALMPTFRSTGEQIPMPDELAKQVESAK